jgi:hypothetical protein
MAEAAQAKTRVVNLFEVPESIQATAGVAEIGMVTLTSDEELTCYKKAKGDSAKLATELAKTALVEADGKKLSPGDGTVDTFWKDLDPKLRQLVLTAYADLHAAPEEDQESFLKSRKQKVG